MTAKHVFVYKLVFSTVYKLYDSTSSCLCTKWYSVPVHVCVQTDVQYTSWCLYCLQMLQFWPFGSVWCSIWLATDVWLCTASIFNLCAISLDRYLAISHPIRYPSLMSPTRARLLIICVWILSFIICFPPLIGWNERGKESTSSDDRIDDVNTSNESSYDLTTYDVTNDVVTDATTMMITTTTQEGAVADVTSTLSVMSLPECTLTSEPGYIVYSACGSFWVPMIGMVIFYWKIYKTAISATDAVRRGFIEKKHAAGSLGNSSSETCLTLRVHRGGGSQTRHSNGCICELLPRPSAVCLQRTAIRRSLDGRLIAAGSGPVAGSGLNGAVDQAVVVDLKRKNLMARPLPKIIITPTLSFSGEGGELKQSQEDVKDDGGRGAASKVDATKNDRTEVVPSKVPSSSKNVGDGSRTTNGPLTRKNTAERRSGSCDDTAAGREQRKNQFLGSDDSPTQKRNSSLISLRFSKLHIISQLRNLNREKKAAKTVGIIVGCFVICWAPFFTVYLAGAFCPDCTPASVFHIFFWLGYCNSAANPFIYGLCSRDFRYAFKTLLRCGCRPSIRRTNSGLLAVLQTFKLHMIPRNIDNNYL